MSDASLTKGLEIIGSGTARFAIAYNLRNGRYTSSLSRNAEEKQELSAMRRRAPRHDALVFVVMRLGSTGTCSSIRP
ncbi:hypothetical protein HYQ46_008019 [Verticillium longisporum]|nr:hypothetical protein HYQ44_009249 [Verticillium longisporum]KAG7140168.1 hypothetical protein HYQ46_008019 [Verticillium longisporum]